MTSRMMAFGTRTNAMFVRAPLKGLAAPMKAVVGQRTLANGQLVQTRSELARKHFDFVFKGTDIELREIRDFMDGHYGPGPFMFNYPRALNGNMLPRSWSQPSLGLSQRGNAAMDFYSNAYTFGAPLSATLNNPNAQPLAISGLADAPVTGRTLWSPSAAAPTLPVNYSSRPFYSILVPPLYLSRITVWGAQNSGTNDPGLYYSLSTLPATTVAAGTKLDPILTGATATPAPVASWRVLDLWIAAGTSTTSIDYTNFGAMDVRIGATTVPLKPTVFSFGRGQFPCHFSEDNIGQNVIRIGNTDAQSMYELDGGMEEVAQPW